jgi:N-acetylneuraminic acid mutarotase
MIVASRVSAMLAVFSLVGCGGGGPPPGTALQSITVAPNPFVTGVGIARQMKATGTLYDGSTVDLTQSVIWSTTQPSVATVTGGVVTGASVGATTIIAQAGMVSGSGMVSVTAKWWVIAASVDSVTGPTPLPSPAALLSDGRVLIVGGDLVTASSPDLSTGLVIYDPIADAWSKAGMLQQGVSSSTATVLASGKVLIAGGDAPLGPPVPTTQLYDAVTSAVILGAPMAQSRSHHTATRLQDGRVLVTGGYPTDSHDVWSASAEIYDPDSNTWSSAGTMSSARIDHTATLLPNGNVLVAGGYIPVQLGSLPTGTTSVDIYNPVSNSWSSAAPMSTPRIGHTATLLPNGKVLVANGACCWYGRGFPDPSASAEVYDPVSNSWSSTGSPTTYRASHTASLLPSGEVLVAGGAGAENDLLSSMSAEIYDPVMNMWTPAANMNDSHVNPTATVLLNGAVLIVGGGAAGNSCELYLP